MGQSGAKPTPKNSVPILKLLQRNRYPALPTKIRQAYRIRIAVQNLWATSEFNMPVLNPRSRKISVRLSEEEYSSLRRLCFATAERNVSDLTRRAVRELLSGTSREGVLRSDLDEFRDHMQKLDQRIEQLAAEFSTLKTD